MLFPPVCCVDRSLGFWSEWQYLWDCCGCSVVWRVWASWWVWSFQLLGLAGAWVFWKALITAVLKLPTLFRGMIARVCVDCGTGGFCWGYSGSREGMKRCTVLFPPHSWYPEHIKGKWLKAQINTSRSGVPGESPVFLGEWLKSGGESFGVRKFCEGWWYPERRCSTCRGEQLDCLLRMGDAKEVVEEDEKDLSFRLLYSSSTDREGLELLMPSWEERKLE